MVLTAKIAEEDVGLKGTGRGMELVINPGEWLIIVKNLVLQGFCWGTRHSGWPQWLNAQAVKLMETHSTSPRRQPWFSGRRWAEFPTSRPRVHDEYGFILNILDAMGSCLQGQWVWIEPGLHDIPTGEHPPEMEPDSWPWLICPTRPAAVSIQIFQSPIPDSPDRTPIAQASNISVPGEASSIST
ncbi:uncharacterized protein An03g04040 [Aspergillus niger]|uniref:Contig An03c0120, genomic contig n=2 Tax=Aspergillus niger TaxID=5061 RepID=A2QGP6_ASPNC|nr:uncharacterized protein An03g04040 [Aspergillus niger]CAK47843.1 unnamed protein product [Aspergillus niger]